MPTQPPHRRSPSGLALVEEGSLRVAPFLHVPRVLEELGADPQALIAEAGIDPTLFDDPENTIPFRDGGRLLALCAERTACPHFGLLAGKDQGSEAMGVVGQLALHSPDMGSALRNVILHLHLHDRGATPTLWVSGDRAVFGYTIYQAEVPGTEQIYDGAIIIAHNLLRTLAGPGWKPTEVRLHRSAPAQIAPYRRLFGIRPRFGADHSAIVFAASWLDRPLGGANVLVHREVMREIDELESLGAGELRSQLRRVLRRMLIGGAYQSQTCVKNVSEMFAIHKRTLNRRLKEQGTSFKTLIDETRYELARQLLRDTHMGVAEVAAWLDYSHPASFDRAFRRWSGTSPSAWRATHCREMPRASRAESG